MKLCMSRFLMSLSLFSVSISSQASLVEDLSQHLKTHIKFPTADFEVVKESEFLFAEDAEKLGNLDIQMSIKLLDKESYLSQFSYFEVDGLGKHLREQDKVLVSKSANVFKSVSPHYFNATSVSHPDYMLHALRGVKSEVLDAEKHIVKQTTDIKFAEIVATVYFASFNFETGEGQMMDRETAEDLKTRFQIQGNPVSVVTMGSGPKDVSYLSHGGKTVKFYYSVGWKDTLLISYELLTIKKEAITLGPIWAKVQSEALKLPMQKKNATASLREYFMNLYSPNAQLPTFAKVDSL